MENDIEFTKNTLEIKNYLLSLSHPSVYLLGYCVALIIKSDNEANHQMKIVLPAALSVSRIAIVQIL